MPKKTQSCFDRHGIREPDSLKSGFVKHVAVWIRPGESGRCGADNQLHFFRPPPSWHHHLIVDCFVIYICRYPSQSCSVRISVSLSLDISSLTIMMFKCLVAVAVAAMSASAQSDIPLSIPLTQFLQNTSAAPYQYPTDFTQGIVPKAFHSHNDYWRQFPLFSALSVGAVSVEADVWLYNGTLHVRTSPVFTNTNNMY